MKNMAVIFVLLGCSLSLLSHSGVAQNYDNSQEHPPIEHLYSPAERDSIFAFLIGDWLDKNYYDELIRTKSPMKALKKSSPLGYLKISKDEEDNNAFNVNMEEDFHQSAFAHFLMEKNDSLKFESNSNLNGYYSIRMYKSQPAMIYFYDHFYKKEVKYIKCPPLTTFINALLLAGTYTHERFSPDNKVICKPDGSIEGLGNLKSYEIGLDIFLGDNDAFSTYINNEIAWFIYVIKGENLYLYNGVWTSETNIDKGKLLYKLTKVK
ncbi:MAG TPA: hypothetical protein PLE74_01830 [Candidatus Cloacimonadota bacterium]|nr:hypothetical protein [Candidatus Cloacimonadota bacterium]HPT71005.1 hypothetical protein [Candidatus Cloacimonadota bacterium]